MILLRSFLFIFLISFSYISAQVDFPLGSEVVDVTKEPYFAKGNGKVDDTEAIQRALDDHPNGDFIIYLPHGTYKISKQLSWPKAEEPTQAYRKTIMQGQSMGGTILILADNARGFENPNIPRAMIYTGIGPHPRHRNAVRDMSLRTGKGNPGAIGIRFNAASQGTVFNVKILSGDANGAGVAGIDMGFAENVGPLLLKNIEIQGFDIGIYCRTPFFGMTLEHIYLSGQRKYGIENWDQSLTIRGLRSRNSVPAIYNTGEYAMLTLIDGTLEYTPNKKIPPGPAIINEAGLFVRGVTTSKYKTPIKSTTPGLGEGIKGQEILEYVSENLINLCHSPKTSMRIPVAEVMELPKQTPANWVKIIGDYGGTAGDGRDVSKAIQEAIDDGAETIYFPPKGRYTINRDVFIRKRVRHIIGTEGRIEGTGRFIVLDGTYPDLTIERFSSFGNGILHKSNRLLLLKNMMVKSYEGHVDGAGDVYMEDVSVDQIKLNFQYLWARQLHMNYDKGTKIINNGGTIWVLGLTAENGNTVLHNKNKGKVELAGVHVISNDKAKTQPMFINDSSNISIEGLRETTIRGNAFHKIIEETRQGLTKTLYAKDLKRGISGGVNIPLYVGYVPKTGSNLAPVATTLKEQILVQPNKTVLSGVVDDDGRADGLCAVPVEWSKIKGPGRAVFLNPRAYETDATFTASGRYDLSFSAHDGQLKGVDTARVYVFDKRYSTLDHSGNNVPSGRGEDAWISEFDAYTPQSKDSLLRIQYAKKGSAKIYLKFDLSAISGPLSDAALQLNVKGSSKFPNPIQWNVFGLKELGKDFNFGDDKLGPDWKNSELTWTNAPANLDEGGGRFNITKGIGGGVDTRFADYLGVITIDSKALLPNFLRSPSFTQFFKRKHPSGLYTLILTATEASKMEYEVYSKKNGLSLAPNLYISYFDSTKTAGGDAMQGGYQLSKIEVDIYTLKTSFSLVIGYPQFVQIEVYNEFGKRMMIIAEKEMESEKKLNFDFKALSLPTGKYILKVIGEAFSTQQAFYILN